jgi:hypothetical protein
MSEVVSYGGGAQSAAIITGAGDVFRTTFAPAQPVLDAVVEMWKPLTWLNRQRRSGRPLFELSRAAELIESIPDSDRLADAGALFLKAEEEPAPEGEAWLHIALGVWLESEPGAVSFPDAFRCAIADSLYRDPTVWGDYEPGFSAAVVAMSIRAARLQGALSPGAFVKLCLKHRRLFRALNSDIDVLMQLRWDAEDELEELQPRLAGWRAPVYPDDDDLPF